MNMKGQTKSKGSKIKKRIKELASFQFYQKYSVFLPLVCVAAVSVLLSDLLILVLGVLGLPHDLVLAQVTVVMVSKAHLGPSCTAGFPLQVLEH